MKKVVLYSFIINGFICFNIFGNPVLNDENLQVQNNYLQNLASTRKTENISDFRNKFSELSNRNEVLENENKLLYKKIQELQNNLNHYKEKMEISTKQIFNLEQNNEELLQKLYDNQIDTQQIKTIPFELNRLIEKIPSNNVLIKNSQKSIEELEDMNERISKILDKSQQIQPNSSLQQLISSIVIELGTMQNLMLMKIESFQEQKETQEKFFNEQDLILSNKLTAQKNKLEKIRNLYPELSKFDFDLNSSEILQEFRLFRKTKSKKDSNKLKSVENILNEYLNTKIQISDIAKLQKNLVLFSENIAKIKILLDELNKRKDKMNSFLEKFLH